MITSSNGNIFRVTGHLCGEFTGHWWRGALMFSLICAWINSSVKKSWSWWFEMPSPSLWCHSSVHINRSIHSWNTFILKLDIENPKTQCQVMVEVKVQGYIVAPTSYKTHIPFVPYQSTFPFLGYGYLEIWPWKFKVKVNGEIKGQCAILGRTTYRLPTLSFHANRPPHSWDMVISKYDLEIPRLRS